MSYDSVGAMASSVACCALLDAVMAGEPPSDIRRSMERPLRLLVVENVFLDELDKPTARAFDKALDTLSAGKATITRQRLKPLESLPELTLNGGIVAAEAYVYHRALISSKGSEYDPRVLVRIEPGGRQKAADYLDMLRLRRILQETMNEATAPFDAIVAPTTAMTAPLMSRLDDDDEYARVNRLMLRNTSLANMLDRPSITIPCHEPENAPVGLMLIGNTGCDKALFSAAMDVEHLLGRYRV